MATTKGERPSPWDTPEAREAHQQQQAATVATEERKTRWKPHWFAVASVDGNAEPWARKLAWNIERRDAFRNPVVDDPTLMFCGVDAVEAGATDAQLTALPKLHPNNVAALRIRAAAIRADCRKQVDTLARSIATERDAVPTPVPVGLAALLAEPDEDAAYRVGEVWPAGGRVLLAAQYKAGKSTTVGNAIRSLVDGDPFLGRFGVETVGTVVLIDTELDRRTLRRWLRDQGIRNTAAVSVVSLRGAVSTFDILDPAVRSDWARQLAGADVVILDCLRPVIDALGLSEDKDAGRVLVAFDALLAELGAGEGMVVTHMGHQNERARGDSRLLNWADALWKIVRGGDEGDDDTARPSFFSALGRDVALPEGKLSFEPSTRHLTYEGGNRRESAGREHLPALLALIAAEPGRLSKRAAEVRLMDDHHLTQRAARAAIAAAVKDGALVASTGARNAQLLRLAGDVTSQVDPFTAADTDPK